MTLWIVLALVAIVILLIAAKLGWIDILVDFLVDIFS